MHLKPFLPRFKQVAPLRQGAVAHRVSKRRKKIQILHNENFLFGYFRLYAILTAKTGIVAKLES